MEVLGVIPARGGSVRIPRKNMREIGGKPLVQWTVEAALGSNLTRVVVATEDPEIAALAVRLGAEIVPRNVESAQLSGMSAQIVNDALAYMSAAHRYDPDAVCLLHPTSPFRTSATIDQAFDIWQEERPCSVITFTDDELNGALYLMGAARFARHRSFFVPPIYPLTLDREQGIDIDTWDDLERARELAA